MNYGIESIRYLGPKISESIPANIKEEDTIEIQDQNIFTTNSLQSIFTTNRIHVGLIKDIY